MRNFIFRFKLNGEIAKKNSPSETESPNQIEYEGWVFLTHFSGVHFLPIDDSADLGKDALHLEILLLFSMAFERFSIALDYESNSNNFNAVSHLFAMLARREIISRISPREIRHLLK